MIISKHILTGLFIGFTALTWGQDLTSETSLKELKGKVKSVYETAFGIANDGSLVGGARQHEDELDAQVFLDTTQRPTRTTTFWTDGSMVWKKDYKYHDDIDSVLQYDEEGLAFLFITDKRIKDRTIALKINHLNEEVSRQTSSLDSDGNVFKYDMNLPDGIFYAVYSTYNNQGLVTDINTISENGDTLIQFYYKYDEKGYKIESGMKGLSNFNTIYFHKNDSLGNPIEIQTYDKGRDISTYQTRTYDHNNNIRTLKNVSKNNEIEEFSFEHLYDVHNNWIEQRTYINGQYKFLVKRKFTYYK